MCALPRSECGLSEYGSKLNDLGVSTIRDLARCRDEVNSNAYIAFEFVTETLALLPHLTVAAYFLLSKHTVTAFSRVRYLLFSHLG